MSEVVILKEDSDIFMELGSGYPYKMWRKKKQRIDSVHSKAKYILEMNEINNWNSWFTGWVNTNKDWLERVANGKSLRTIISVISITKLNDSDMEDAILTKKPLIYESGDSD